MGARAGRHCADRGGMLGFLPVLGFWMLPIGLALLAYDVPPMRPPLARVLRFTNSKIAAEKRAQGRQKGATSRACQAVALRRKRLPLILSCEPLQHRTDEGDDPCCPTPTARKPPIF